MAVSVFVGVTRTVVAYESCVVCEVLYVFGEE